VPPIKGPSVEMMVKKLKISKKDAALLKKLMQEGNLDGTFDLADTILNGYGIETITHESIWVGRYFCNIGLLYVNRGETYMTTLCYDTLKEQFIISNWGDWVEKNLMAAHVSGNKHIQGGLTSAKPTAKPKKPSQKIRR